MATRFNDYRFRDGKTRLSADEFNARFRDIDARIVALERIQEEINAASDKLVALGLERINEVFAPLVADLQEQADNLDVEGLATATQGALAQTALQPESIGDTVQEHGANLDAFAALSGAADKLAYFTAANTLALATLTAAARQLLQATDKAAMRSILELVPGAHVQAQSAALNEWAAKGRPSGDVVGTSDTQTLTGKTITAAKETKTAPSISSGALTLNCATGNVFEVALNENVTSLSFSNVPASGTAFGAVLVLVGDGTQRTVTWPASVKWPGDSEPTITATNGKKDIAVLTTWDGGTTWYATLAGQNF